MVATKTASVNARVGALAKSAGQPYAGKPHVRLEEGAPVEQPCEDTQAPPTERDGNSYGLATAKSDRALLHHMTGQKSGRQAGLLARRAENRSAMYSVYLSTGSAGPTQPAARIVGRRSSE